MSDTATGPQDLPQSAMRIEVIVIPVSDVDRAKRFYTDLGWRLDLDIKVDNNYRVIQFTPPGSACSIMFGCGITNAPPGSVQGLTLAVSDIGAMRAQLLDHGIQVSNFFHDAGGLFHHAAKERLSQGLQPQRNSYGSYASFLDPDGNAWVLQEITVRLTGNVDGTPLSTVNELLASLYRANAAFHGERGPP